MSRFVPGFTVLLLAQCSKCKGDDPTPQSPKDLLSLLPPETQTGAGTFSCLLNGQPWLPSGTLNVPNFFIVYDPTPKNDLLWSLGS